MADVDPVTGLPRQVIGEARKEMQNARDRIAVDEAFEIQRDLQSKPGKKLAEIIQSLLAQRIDAIVKQDLQAQAYIRLLNEIGVRLEVGKEAAKRLTSQYMKM